MWEGKPPVVEMYRTESGMVANNMVASRCGNKARDSATQTSISFSGMGGGV